MDVAAMRFVSMGLQPSARWAILRDPVPHCLRSLKDG
jgi:hypothetical protein